MRAISLWQPWASLWIDGVKIHETRHWATSYRGPLLVHATQHIERDHVIELATLLYNRYGSDWMRTLPRGALLGILELTDCLPTDAPKLWEGNAMPQVDQMCGDFTPGRFAWRGRDRRPFETPIPFRGHQGFFSVPDELLRSQ